MMIVYDDDELSTYMDSAVDASQDRPVLVDRFLEDATEVDVDCISDGETTVIGSVMEHIEQAGVHSGDSACVIPPFSLGLEVQDQIRSAAKALAKALDVCGLMNIQFAVKDGQLYVIEVNPRASRTVPFVSKAIGVPLAKLAAKVMAGQRLADLGFTREIVPEHYSVKEAVFPFVKFPGVDIILGPEMKSTGEVMGIDHDFGLAFAKSQSAAGSPLPLAGNVFISVKDGHKDAVVPVARGFHELGFQVFATSGTARHLDAAGVPNTRLFKLAEQRRPNVLDMIKNGEIQLVVNTPASHTAREDEVRIRSAAVANRVAILTTLRAAEVSIQAIRSLQANAPGVRPLQDYHPQAAAGKRSASARPAAV
jgi:carbamoyl-phosphate synthase large subunit